MTLTFKRTLFVTAIWLFSLFYYLECRALPDISEKLSITVVFWAFTAVTIFHLIGLVRNMKVEGRVAPAIKQIFSVETIRNAKVRMIAIACACIFLIPLLGFFVTSFLTFCALSFALGNRNLLKSIVSGLILLLVVYGIFIFTLNLELPRGLLF